MPKRRRAGRRSRKFVSKRPRTRRTQASGVGRSGGTVVRLNRYIFGNKFLCRLTYVTDQDTLTPVAGLTAVTNFRANSIFDPEEGVGGHQPFYHDQLQSFYKKYRVISSTCSVRSTGSIGHIVGVEVRDNNGTILTVSNYLEKPSVRTGYSSSDDLNTKSFVRHSWSAKQWRGPAGADDDDMAADFGFNPANGYIFAVSVMGRADSAPTCTIQTRINYWVLCYDVTLPGPS